MNALRLVRALLGVRSVATPTSIAVSQLIAQGANILQIARIAGHADPSITLRVYSHLMAGGLADAAAVYDPLAEVAVDHR